MYLSNLDNSTYPFISHPKIQHMINTADFTPYQYYQLHQSVAREIFAPMIHGRSDIFGISLILKNKPQINDYSNANEQLDMNRIRERNEQLLSVLNDMESFQVLGLRQFGSTPVITVVRKLSSHTTYLFEGLLVIDLKLQQLEKISKNVASGDMNFWIADGNGQVIYHPKQDQIGQLISQDVLQQSLSQPEGVYRSKEMSNQAILYTRSQTTDWIIAADVPLEPLVHSLIHFRNVSLATGLAVLLVALLSLSGFSYSITRSLNHLRRLMAKVESGNFKITSTFTKVSHAEIESVFRSFFTMVHRINQLMEEIHSSKLKEQTLIIKEKETALQAMQAQINPHFLYNTLEIINSHAIIENNMNISKMTRALAHMFRYNTGSARHVVTLTEEIQHIQSYLDIQQARFSSLIVNISLEQAGDGEVIMVRLTLQPLLENAFIHGYRNKKPTYIGITGTQREGCYSIRIEDKGAGIAPEIREYYNRLFEADTPDDDKAAAGQIGLINVHQRIRMTFGTPYGVYIPKPASNEGTAFELLLPIQKGVEEYVPFNDR